MCTSFKAHLRLYVRRKSGLHLHIDQIHAFYFDTTTYTLNDNVKTKRRRSDPVLWQKPLHQQKCQKGKVTTQTTPQKFSIKQQLRTDLGRSVGVTKATQLVWLTWFTGQPSHSPQQPCNQKDTHLKFVNKPPYIDNKPTATPSGEVIKINTHTA